MTSTEIRETLTSIADAVDVPTVDQVAFQARVRSERRRRAAGRVLVASAAAAVVAVGAGVLLDARGGDHRVLEPANPGPTAAAQGLTETVWFVRDGELTALDPSGRLHPMGVPSEGVVGWTSERVYALDDESHVIVRTVEYDDEGLRTPTFGDETSPVPGAVESAVLSGDGRYLGWLDLAGTAHRLDLEADQVDLEVGVPRQGGLVDVGADGLLVYDAGRVELRTARATVVVSTAEDGSGATAQLAMGHVLVPGRDGHSRLYDVTAGQAELVATMAGFGRLGPYAERVAVLPFDPDSGRELRVWDGGTVSPMTGLDAVPDAVRWADETTLLVSAHVGSSGVLYTCDIELRCAQLPVDGELSLNE